MSILVTGAAGFIGSQLVERFLEDGQSVVGLDNFDPFYERSLKERNLEVARDHEAFHLLEGDIRDAEFLQGLPDDIDFVVHLAALAGVRPSIADPIRYTDVNLMGTSQLLEWSNRRGADRIIYASSSSVYGNNEKVPFAESDPL